MDYLNFYRQNLDEILKNCKVHEAENIDVFDFELTEEDVGRIRRLDTN